MSNIMIKFWLWAVLLMVVANGCREEERRALLELQASMTGSLLSIWEYYSDSDCCSWVGVKCNLETGRVIQLSIGQAMYMEYDSWRFNASLFLPFKSLEFLGLAANNIIGWTENEGFDKLAQLASLKVLDLRQNPLPLHQNVLSSLCSISSLEVLRLDASSFNMQTNFSYGSISDKCSGLSHLRVLWLAGYGLKDTSILSALGLGTHAGLKNLENLNLQDNNFNSSIFSSLRDLPSLKHLDLSLNEIDGKIETSDIFALSNLKHLNLRMNNFERFATTEGSKTKSSLRNLILGDSGSNPNSSNILQSLKSFSSLKSLSYKYSDLTPPTITDALRNLSSLEYLDLEGSNLNDNFLSSIGQMSSLKVLSLAFGNNYGTLPNQGWCELKNIQELDFRRNYFNGALPSCLGNLTSLRLINLNANKLKGNIASFPVWGRLTSLEFLNIGFNQFEVPLSFRKFSNNSKLTYLDVSYATITRETEFKSWIPTFQLQVFSMEGCISLQNMPSFLHHQYDLRIIDIATNQLQGNFPTWLLENNTRLAGLYARDNAFTGSLKLPSISLLHLESIDVSNNKLYGHIPTNLGSVFPKLHFLNMSQNILEGPIPSKIGGFSLGILDLSHNLLSGGVPRDLAISSPGLWYLRLSNNYLKGQIFSKDVIPRILRVLYLNGNNFDGPLVTSNLFIRSLVVLDASDNHFSAEIPGWIRDNTGLLQLDLSKNHLEGSIPIEICNLKHIQVLAMSKNRLSGYIPSCLSSLPLQHIHLDKNQLCGELELGLSNISSLVTLDLSYNSFTGNIPHTIGSLSNLKFLLVKNNHLEGEIPSQICLLNKLSILDFSYNKLYGPLHYCLGNLTQADRFEDTRSLQFAVSTKYTWLNFLGWMKSRRHFHYRYAFSTSTYFMDVETVVQFSTKRNSYLYKGSVLQYMTGIDLSSNNLTGRIPVELGNLSKLHALNLSHNHLVGRIPDTFSNLHEVESLDLSHNRLNGKIPVGLLELHYMGTFSVANNNLSGAIPQSKDQFGTFDKSSYEGNPFLCGHPLDNNCDSTNFSNVSNNVGTDEHEIGYMESFYIGFCVSYGSILLGFAATLFFNHHWRRAWFRLVEEVMSWCYYFILDNVVVPFKTIRLWRNLG